MKYPESFKNCDSTHLDLKSTLNSQGKYEIVSSEISVIWASGILTRNHLSDNELLHIARSNPKTEYLKTSVKITFSNPFCICRIYPNGRILIMGALTEQQAYKRLAKTVRKIKYRTKWKVILPNRTPSFSFNFSDNLRDFSNNNRNVTSTKRPTDGHTSVSYKDTNGNNSNLNSGNSRIENNNMNVSNLVYTSENTKKRREREYGKEIDSMRSAFSRRRTSMNYNGLEWRYIENENILKVSQCLETFRIDQLFCKVVLNKELNLNEIYFRLAKLANVKFFDNYLRFQFNLDTSDSDQLNSFDNYDPNNKNDNNTTTNRDSRTDNKFKDTISNLNERINVFGPNSPERYSRGFDSGDLDISQELERELEAGMVYNKTRSCLVFKSGKISILGCVNRPEIFHIFNQLIELLF